MTVSATELDTNANQNRAANPTASAWVSANAGTGKTYVLTRRVLRLLLNGTAPDQILCLTYTKAAAAEMSRRVFDELAEWAVTPPEILAETLEELEGAVPGPAQLTLAPTLFARAIETPGGLKVQTIHAFCERLLQRFPLEAGIAPDFGILDEDEQKELLTQSIDQVLEEATKQPGSSLHTSMTRAVTYAADDSFDQLLGAILGKREALLEMIADDETGGDWIARTTAQLKTRMGLPTAVTLDTINAARAEAISVDFAAHAAVALAEGTKTDGARADLLNTFVRSANKHEKISLLTTLFLTATGTMRKSLITKKPAAAYPDVESKLVDAQQHFATLTDQAGALGVIQATISIVHLAEAIFTRYTNAKRRRAALDYDDLIMKTVALVSNERDAQWVLYKLDNGLDHVLVDEAQDTSPTQWRIIARLAEEFFSGIGISDTTRTLFAVGDEKQSIYGFQGARPEMFATMGQHFRERADHVEHDLHAIPLTMSFRTVAPVLEAVDRTFSKPETRDGITAGSDAISHVAFRATDAGLVEIWPTEKPDETPESSAWRPLDEEAVAPPLERLANKIATTVRRWLDDGVILPSTGQPIVPGDILILVRRRNPVAPAMIRALKAAQIAVAGADRIRITEQIAVMDLMRLGDFVLLPDDDLALATVLKSPLFGLDDNDLLAIAYGRKGSLWNSLLGKASEDEKYTDAAETLKRWRQRAGYAPPFEFFSLLLDREGRRAKMLERLGPEAGDALDEFLNQAIQYDDNNPPSLQGFLEWLRSGGPEIRRDMEQGRNEVRIMTVHGAKGLEAPIVFLPDTCGTASGGRGPTVLPLAPSDDTTSPLIWSVKGTGDVSAVRAAKNHRKSLDDQEYRRLLYVAMTRARDRLYIAGYEGKTKPAETCWYNLMFNALHDDMMEIVEPDGGTIWRLEKQTDGEILPTKQKPGNLPVDMPPKPGWMSRPAPRERVRSIPVMPSRIMPLEEEEARDSLASDTPTSPLKLAENHRFQRGVLTHALLQHLPLLPVSERRGAAELFISARGAALSDNLKSSIIDETLTILEAEHFLALFGEGSQAEVSIAAEIANPKDGGRSLHVTGTIDRLVVGREVVQFVDFKTNRPPPHSAAEVTPAYIAQLSAYRLVLQKLYPDHRLEAALLWTDGARIMAIPSEELDAIEPLLWSGGGGLEAVSESPYLRVN